MKTIERLKEAHSDIFLDDDNLYYLNGDDPVYVQIGGAKELIEEYYDNEEVCDNPNDDPEKHTYSKVSGEEYIEYNFNSYEEALHDI